MIYLNRAKNKEFYVLITNDKGESLQDCETEKTRRSCYKNTLAVGKNFGAIPPYRFTDNSRSKPPFEMDLYDEADVREPIDVTLVTVKAKKK